MAQTTLLETLRSADRAVPIHRAEEHACGGVTGLYAIFIDSEDNLPDPFRHRLIQKGTTLIYIGKADKCLNTRLVHQDLQHRKGRSTFFRSIGAVLGFRPAAGSLRGKKNTQNYTFNREDTAKIVEWIEAHLRILCTAMTCEEIAKWEPYAIGVLRPILNLDDNPDAMPELRELRAECRRIAMS